MEKSDLIIVRPYIKNDVEAVMELIHRNFDKMNIVLKPDRKQHSKYIEAGFSYIAHSDNNETVGYILGLPRSKNEVYIELFGVSDLLTDQKVGTRLLEEFEKNAAKEKYTQSSLGSLKDVVGFYKKLGYTSVERYGGKTVEFMEKKLKTRGRPPKTICSFCKTGRPLNRKELRSHQAQCKIRKRFHMEKVPKTSHRYPYTCECGFTAENFRIYNGHLNASHHRNEQRVVTVD